jgi:hypothetical protein
LSFVVQQQADTKIRDCFVLCAVDEFVVERNTTQEEEVRKDYSRYDNMLVVVAVVVVMSY